MKGSIVTRTAKDGTRRYHVVVRAGGKQRWKTFTKAKEAERYLATLVKSVHDGAYTAVKPRLMSDVFKGWLADLETRRKLAEVKPSTAKSYASVVNTHLEPALGDHRSDQLTAAVLSEWRQGMAARVADDKLARKSFNNILNLLHAILAWARHPAQSYLAHDPLIGQKRLQLDAPERDFLEDADIAALLGAAGSVENDAILHVGLFAGLRRGELFGLQWSDIEPGDGKNGGRLHVRRSVYQGDVTAPKTKNSTRVVDVPQRVLDVLGRHREASPPMDGDFVFHTAAGTPVDPDNFYKRVFAGIRQRAGLRATVGLHTLRHTYASLLIRQNESLKYVSAQLGHASIQITADTYGHLFASTSKQAMKRLNKMVPAPNPAATPERRLRIVGGRG